MINTNFSESISETLEVLKHMDKSYINKIPEKFKIFLEKNKDANYVPKLDFSKDLNELSLNELTKDILAVIYINYWCEVEQKKNYISLIKENEIKYQKELRKKYNSDNMFKNNITFKLKQNKKDNVKIVPVRKTNIFKKIINRVKGIFHKL